jgi:hypothetical protein
VTLGQTGDQPRAQSRELKFRAIFNSRTAQPSQVLDFKAICSAKGAHRASAEPDEEKPNPLESFQIGHPDLSHLDILSLISAAESRKTAAFGLLTPRDQFRAAARGAGRRCATEARNGSRDPPSLAVSSPCCPRPPTSPRDAERLGCAIVTDCSAMRF